MGELVFLNHGKKRLMSKGDEDFYRIWWTCLDVFQMTILEQKAFFNFWDNRRTQDVVDKPAWFNFRQETRYSKFEQGVTHPEGVQYTFEYCLA